MPVSVQYVLGLESATSTPDRDDMRVARKSNQDALFLAHWQRRLMAEANNFILLTHAPCYLPCD